MRQAARRRRRSADLPANNGRPTRERTAPRLGRREEPGPEVPSDNTASIPIRGEAIHSASFMARRQRCEKIELPIRPRTCLKNATTGTRRQGRGRGPLRPPLRRPTTTRYDAVSAKHSEENGFRIGTSGHRGTGRSGTVSTQNLGHEWGGGRKTLAKVAGSAASRPAKTAAQPDCKNRFGENGENDHAGGIGPGRGTCG